MTDSQLEGLIDGEGPVRVLRFVARHFRKLSLESRQLGYEEAEGRYFRLALDVEEILRDMEGA